MTTTTAPDTFDTGMVRITVDVPVDKKAEFQQLWMQILSSEDNPVSRTVEAANRTRAHVATEGVAALKRLYEIALRDSGQCRIVAGFLAGLYNGQRFPFKLTDLRGVDDAIFEDCMALLRMDARQCEREVHDYFDNGNDRWEKMIQDWKLDK
jgi:hypothetical protein